jgi:hypothetical protein
MARVSARRGSNAGGNWRGSKKRNQKVAASPAPLSSSSPTLLSSSSVLTSAAVGLVTYTTTVAYKLDCSTTTSTGTMVKGPCLVLLIE